MRARVTADLEDRNEVEASYYAADTLVLGDCRVPTTAWINVRFGDALDLSGPSEVVLRTLREALVAACEAAGMEYVITDVGGEA